MIRRHKSAFQKASVIVMRANYPNGYILKESFKIRDKDDEAKWININLPGAKQDLNLGQVHLQIKYATQIKMKANKMEGLQKIRLSLGADAERWIDDLVAEQVHAKDYKDDEEDLSLFPVETLGMDNILE